MRDDVYTPCYYAFHTSLLLAHHESLLHYFPLPHLPFVLNTVYLLVPSRPDTADPQANTVSDSYTAAELKHMCQLGNKNGTLEGTATR